MAIIDKGFEKILSTFDLNELDVQQDTTFGIWADLRLAYMNQAWFDFARDNNGEPMISDAWGLGMNVLDACGDDLKPFFRDHYEGCLRLREISVLEYECSSAGLFRKFHQIAYPLGDGAGLLVVHARLVEHPHDLDARPPHPPDWSIYPDKQDIITQCSHCRRTRNPQQEGRWDWVPAWVEQIPTNVSHGLCQMCLIYYYPDPET